MFRTGQIINATQLVRHFKKISKYLDGNPQPILITQKKQAYLVLVPAELFEDLACRKLESDGVNVPDAYLRDEITLGI